MVRVAVSVTEEYAGDLARVAESLRRAGLVVDAVLDALAVVTGDIEEEAIPGIEALPEVAAVERQRRHRLPPPDSDVE